MTVFITVPQAKPNLTQLAFRRLFAPTERISIDDAENNVALSAQQKATVRTMQRDMALATDISLTDPETIQGVNYLVYCNLITQARADSILLGLPYAD